MKKPIKPNLTWCFFLKHLLVLLAQAYDLRHVYLVKSGQCGCVLLGIPPAFLQSFGEMVVHFFPFLFCFCKFFGKRAELAGSKAQGRCPYMCFLIRLRAGRQGRGYIGLVLKISCFISTPEVGKSLKRHPFQTSLVIKPAHSLL